jgi:quinol monooxygenase YgiN
MITRIVKMTFRHEAREEFLAVFNANKAFIAASEGCRSLQMLNEKSQPAVFFTISTWDSEADLNRYRNSALFENVWGKTKAMFAAKPEAWTLEAL